MRRAGLLVLLSLVPALARAQECPVVNGLSVTLSTGDSTRVGAMAGARPRSTDTAFVRRDARTSIDTVWRFNFSERRWTRPYIVASVGAGWAGDDRRPGTTTAPDTRAWSACASAAVGMRDPTLILRGVRGLVRLRADLTPLSRAGRVRADSSQPRR